MRPSPRLWLLLAGALGTGAMLVWGISGLPPAGQYRGPYGDLVNAATVPERHTTDAVTAVNFDFRGFDTLGEEFILFTSVVGVLALLRKQRGEIEEKLREQSDEAKARKVPRSSDAIRVLGVGLVGLTVCFGLYIVSHGQISPGGGFQGGVILATAPLVVYLCVEAKTFRRITPQDVVRVIEAAGAGAYVVVGLLGVFAGATFLQNVLPLGKPATILSAGTILVINVAVGVEVAAGFVLLLTVFLQETLERRTRAGT